MISLRAWTADRKEHLIKDSVYGRAFDYATEIGARKVIDGDGWVWARLQGEWVAVSQIRHRKRQGGRSHEQSN